MARTSSSASAHSTMRSTKPCARDHPPVAPGIGRPEREQYQAGVIGLRGVPAGGAAYRGGSAGCRHTGSPPRRRRMLPPRPARRARCPSRSCCTTVACGAASRCTASMSGPTTTTMRSNTCSQLRSRWRNMDRPAMRCSVFGRADFMRVPSPAARMTAVACMPIPCDLLADDCPHWRSGGLPAVSKIAVILLVQFAFRSATPWPAPYCSIWTAPWWTRCPTLPRR